MAKKVILKSFNSTNNYNLEKDSGTEGKILIDKRGKSVNIDGVEFTVNENNSKPQFENVNVSETWFRHSFTLNNLIDNPSLFFNNKRGFSRQGNGLLDLAKAKRLGDWSGTATLHLYKVNINSPSIIKANIKGNDNRIILGCIFKTNNNVYGYKVFDVLDSNGIWSDRENEYKFEGNDISEFYFFGVGSRWAFGVNSIMKKDLII